jgi:hypothetical protein
MKCVPFILTVIISAAGGVAAGLYLPRKPEAPAQAASPADQVKSVPATMPAAAGVVFQPPGNPQEGQKSLRQLMDFARSRPNLYRGLATLVPVIDGWSAEQVRNAASAVLASSQNWHDPKQAAVRELIISRMVEIDPKGALAVAKSAKGSEKSNALSLVLGHMALTDLPQARSMLNSLSAVERKDVVPSMAARLMELDPAQGIGLMNSEKVPPGDFSWFSVYGAWGARDPAGFASAAANIADGPQRSRALFIAADTLASHDPQQALAWAKALPRASEAVAYTRRIVDFMAERDPEAALRAVEQQPARERRDLYATVADGYMRADPEKGTQWIASLQDKALQQSLIAKVTDGFAGWVRPDEMRKLVELLPDGKARRDSISNLAGGLANRDADQALVWLETLKPDDRQAAAERMVGTIGWSDPQKAASLAGSLMPTANAIENTGYLASAWASRDPEAALKWAGSLETEKMRKDASARILQSWADTAPDKAAAASGEITDADTRGQARTAIAEAWARKSPQEALEWASGLPAEDRFNALAKVWAVTATDDPAKSGSQLAQALQEASGISGATDGLNASAGTVAKTWTIKNPGEAAAWASGLTEGKVRDAALAGVAAQWAETDQTGASQWVKSLPPGNSRDEAVGSLVKAIAAGDPEAAFQWAATVADADKQLALLKSTLSTWKGFNPGAARQAVESAGVSNDLRAKLLEELR